MSQSLVDFGTFGTPTRKEEAQDANIRQSAASTAASSAAMAASKAATEQRRAIMPSTVRGAAAVAKLNEVRAATSELALEKIKRMMANMPEGEKAGEFRALVLNQLRNIVQAKKLSQDMFGASGIGYTTLSQFSGSPAAQVDGLMASVLADESFTALQKMRAESPTGGALGNITEKELELLKAAGGYIPPTAGDDAFQQGLDDLIEKRISILNKLGTSPQEYADALGPDNIDRFGSLVQSYRFREADEAALNSYISKTMADGTFDPSDYAALMGQAYYNVSGNAPDERFATSAYEIGAKIANDGAVGSPQRYNYSAADDDFRGAFRRAGGAAPEDELGLGEVLGGAAINFLPSTFELVADTVLGLTVNLPETLEGAAQIIGGATGLSDPAQYEAVKAYFGERYGTIEGFKRAVMTDPASILADVAGIATGGGLLIAGTASKIANITRIAKMADLAKKADGFTAAAARLDPINIAAATTGKVVSGAAGAGTRIFGSVAGLTGAKPTDLGQAVGAGKRGSGEFLNRLEGGGDPGDILVKADNAVAELYEKRRADYTRHMDQLKQSPEILPFADVDAAINGVRDIGYHRGIAVSGAAKVWDEVDDMVAQFRDKNFNSIEDFDMMKRGVTAIGQKFQPGTPDYRVASQVAQAINKTITQKAPIYANIMRDYRSASDTLADLRATISLDARSADTTLGKLGKAVSGTGPRGRTVLDLIENTSSGAGLGDMVAGTNLANATPNAVGSSLASLGTGAAAVTGDPTTLAASLLSAQGLGRAAYGMGEVSGQFGRVGDRIMQTPGAQNLLDLAKKYADPLREGIRVANPALIQPQVDPVEITQPVDLETLVRAYSAQPPGLMPSGSNPMAPGAPTLDDYTASGAEQPAIDLGGFRSTYTDVAPEAAPAQTTQIVDGRITDIDPVTGQRIFIDTDEPVGMARGGAVKGYNRGGAVKGYQDGGYVASGPMSRAEVGSKVRTLIEQGRSAEEIRGFLESVEPGLSERARNLDENVDFFRKAGYILKPPVDFTSTAEDARMPLARRGAQVLGVGADLTDMMARYIGQQGDYRDTLNRRFGDIERDFALRGGAGAQDVGYMSNPASLASLASRPGEVPRAIEAVVPRAAQSAIDYARETTPSQFAGDVGSGLASMYEAVKENPYGFALDAALYSNPYTGIPAAAFDSAEMREAADMIGGEGGQTLDALSVLPFMGVPVFRRAARSLKVKPTRRSRGGAAKRRSK